MEKIEINGERYVRVKDIRLAVRALRKAIPARYRNFIESDRAMVHLAYNDILKALYSEEFALADTPEKIRAVVTLDTDFTEKDARELMKLADEFLAGNDSPEAKRLKANIQANIAAEFGGIPDGE